jgi:hypothetical protein
MKTLAIISLVGPTALMGLTGGCTTDEGIQPDANGRCPIPLTIACFAEAECGFNGDRAIFRVVNFFPSATDVREACFDAAVRIVPFSCRVADIAVVCEDPGASPQSKPQAESIDELLNLDAIELESSMPASTEGPWCGDPASPNDSVALWISGFRPEVCICSAPSIEPSDSGSR